MVETQLQTMVVVVVVDDIMYNKYSTDNEAIEEQNSIVMCIMYI